MPAGRPSKYSKALGDEICRRLAEGESLRAICRDEDETMPSEAAVRGWALDLQSPFSAQYAKARELQAERWSDELLDIADDGTNDFVKRETDRGATVVVDSDHIARSRLRVDTRKWLLSKMLPKKYGEKLVHGGDPANPIGLTIRWQGPGEGKDDQ
jgi:hypothetical protein